MITLYQDPKEEKFIETQLSQSTKNNILLRSMNETKEEKSEIVALQVRIKELEDTITKFQVSFIFNLIFIRVLLCIIYIGTYKIRTRSRSCEQYIYISSLHGCSI